MSVLKTFSSANAIVNADIRKCFKFKGRGGQISLSAEQLKRLPSLLLAYHLPPKKIQIRHLVCQIELPEKQLSEIDKRIEEFSVKSNSTILSIPGISHFYNTSIIAESGTQNHLR